MSFFKIVQHLLPRGAAWKLAYGSSLRNLVDGITRWADDAQTFIGMVLLDQFAAYTRQLDEWEAEFGIPKGLTEANRRAAIAGEKALIGGTAPLALQTVIDKASFAATVYECWLTGPAPWIARDPTQYTIVPLVGTVTCGSGHTCGDGSTANAYLSNEPRYLANKDLTRRAPPMIPAGTSRWPFFVYIADPLSVEVPAVIDLDRRAEFERLLLRMRPLRHWLVTSVRYVSFATLTAAKYWFKSDDPGTNIDTGGNVLLSLPNRGTLGGTFDGDPSTAMGIMGQKRTVWSVAGGLYRSDAADFLHQAGANATLTIKARLDDPSSSQVLFATRHQTANSNGMLIRFEAPDLVMKVGNGTGETTLSQAVPGVSGTADPIPLTVQVRKTGLNYEFGLNGVFVSGAASSLSSSAAATRMNFGEAVSPMEPWNGQIAEAIIRDTALTDAQLKAEREYLDRWNGFAPYADTASLWLATDDPGATFSSGAYVTVPNRGNLGGNVIPATGPGPELGTVANKPAALTTTNGGFKFGDTSSLQELHSPLTRATISMLVQVDVMGATRLFGTRNSSGAPRGVLLELNATTLRLFVADGSGSETLSLTGGPAVSAGLHLIQVRKTGLLYEVLLNGSLYQSGAASALSNGTHGSSPQIGSSASDTSNLQGSVCELLIIRRALTDAELKRQRLQYFARWGYAGA